MRRSIWIWMLAAALLAAVPAIAAARSVDTRTSQQILRPGDRGKAVLTLQEQLAAAGFDPGPLDGIYGPRTESAVRAAQARWSLQVDGLAGPLTAAALARRTVATAEEQREGAPAVAERSLPAVSLVVHQAVPSARLDQASQHPPELFSLTFNGAPDPERLPGLLDLLRQHGMHATFFVLGKDVEENPALIAAIAAAGHEIASNGYADLDMTQITEQMRTAQLRHAQRVIQETVGKAPAFFRPPGGRFNQALARAAETEGLQMVLWSNVAVRDSGDLPGEDLAEQLVTTVYPGAVLMLHQDRPSSLSALQHLLPELRRRGYQSVTLSRLIPDPERL